VGVLGFFGNRLPDREARVDEFFLRAAEVLPERRFVLGGAGWEGKRMPSNVHCVGHVHATDHNAFNVSPGAILNVSRSAMARYGHTPATRVFEGAGAGACVITDAWVGLEQFLEPDREVLLARDGDEVARHVEQLTPERAAAIGEQARARMLREHTYAHRAVDIEEALGERGRRYARSDRSLDIVFLGLSITSSWGNGHATTYRALVRGLAARGHRVRFLERDAPWFANHRDLPSPPYARTELYGDLDELRARHATAVRDADLVVVGSYVPDGIAVGRWVVDTARGLTAFYDLETPITLSLLGVGDCAYLDHDLVRRYGMYLPYSGGPTLRRIERDLGSPRALPLYCSVDPDLYAPDSRPARWDLGFMGTFSVDRQRAVEALLLEPARRRSDLKVVLAGTQYPAATWPTNVERIEHLEQSLHRLFYNQLRFTLNITRARMAATGWSPSVRLFEAAACGAAIISDPWDGLEELFEPGEEILVASSTEDVLRHLRDVGDVHRRAIGSAALARVRRAHTAQHRAADLERYARSA
jgi:spore maturation protein CgeB